MISSLPIPMNAYTAFCTTVFAHAQLYPQCRANARHTVLPEKPIRKLRLLVGNVFLMLLPHVQTSCHAMRSGLMQSAFTRQ